MAMTMIAPWIDFYREVEALFKTDPYVRVVYDDEAKELKLYVEDSNKAYAMTETMPTHRQFGNVDLKILIIPSNATTRYNIKAEDYFQHIFDGNPILDTVKSVYGIMSNPITYVVFRKEVVQYFNDDLGDINGLRSTLWQEIARDVFTEAEGVYFCTGKETCTMTCSPDGSLVFSHLGSPA